MVSKPVDFVRFNGTAPAPPDSVYDMQMQVLCFNLNCCKTFSDIWKVKLEAYERIESHMEIPHYPIADSSFCFAELLQRLKLSSPTHSL